MIIYVPSVSVTTDDRKAQEVEIRIGLSPQKDKTLRCAFLRNRAGAAAVLVAKLVINIAAHSRPPCTPA